MKKNKSLQVTLPVICTRGIIVFPGQDVVIEVGREKSINAVNEAELHFDGHVWVVCQNDIMEDDPSYANIYKFGTLCRIKSIRKKDGFMRVTFTGLERAELIQYNEEEKMIMATIQPVVDEAGQEIEELALVKRVASEFESVAGNTTHFPPEIIS